MVLIYHFGDKHFHVTDPVLIRELMEDQEEGLVPSLRAGYGLNVTLITERSCQTLHTGK